MVFASFAEALSPLSVPISTSVKIVLEKICLQAVVSRPWPWPLCATKAPENLRVSVVDKGASTVCRTTIRPISSSGNESSKLKISSRRYKERIRGNGCTRNSGEQNWCSSVVAVRRYVEFWLYARSRMRELVSVIPTRCFRTLSIPHLHRSCRSRRGRWRRSPLRSSRWDSFVAGDAAQPT